MKEKLLNNEYTIGSWITLAHPGIAEIMAKAGFDWLAVDLEHSVITIREAEELIRIINLSGVSPLVRLTSNDPNQIKRVMDSGAHGIIVPNVRTSDEVKRAVSSTKYPLKGNRGVGLARAQGYGSGFEEYNKWQENETVVIVQIESIEAVDNLKNIFSTDGIDAYIIGPYDLSGSLGIPGQFDHPDFIATVDKINTLANEMAVVRGIHIIEPDINELGSCINQGYKFIGYSLDIRMLDVSCRSAINSYSPK